MSEIKNLKLALTKKQYLISTILVLLLAIVLRFYKLGIIPHGMTWDEAAIGYNGFSVLTTRRDEWLMRLPISFWSFGDYKAPLAIYLNGFFTFLFGMNLFAVRLPFAIAGVLAVWGMIRLTNLLVRSRFWAIVAGLFIALSPWHLHFSRAGFESGLSLMAVIWGTYFFIKALRVKKKWRIRVDSLLFVMGFVASIYAYHSAKIFSPLWVLALVLFNRKIVFKKWKEFSLSVVAGILMLGPFIYDSFFGKGLTRAGDLILSQGYGWVEIAQVFYRNLLAHLSPNFLIFGEVTTLRHGDGKWGILFFTTFFAVIIALIIKMKSRKKEKLSLAFPLIWIFIGLLPATLGEGVPHGNRAILALPGFILLAVMGLKAVMELIKDLAWKKIFIGGFVLLHSFLFVNYLSDYYGEFAANSSADFQDGYLEAFDYVMPYERGLDGRREVQKIIFTADYGQPYIYALFARKTSPLDYHGGSLIKYEFKDEITIGDLEKENTIVVASDTDELLGKNDKADKIIYGSDGLVRFRIYLPDGSKP